MKRLAVAFTSESPGIDEQAVQQEGTDPQWIAEELARRKALAVFERNPDAIVIGSDQVAVVDNRVLNKPGNAENATAQLRELRGHEHRLVTAVAIAHTGGLVQFSNITRLLMRNLTDGEIARYVRTEQPFECAGSYKIEELGITLFERIDTHDSTAIIGLPLIQLSEELRKLGVPLP